MPNCPELSKRDRFLTGAALITPRRPKLLPAAADSSVWFR